MKLRGSTQVDFACAASRAQQDPVRKVMNRCACRVLSKIHRLLSGSPEDPANILLHATEMRR
jgi:hypothetical protein